MIGENKKINTPLPEEKENILKNARTSFVHGIEHLVKYKKAKKHIKFAILHIFHTVELIVKAHLGEINKALLRRDIDKNKNDKRSADISILIARMADFSEVQFNPKLISKIEELREKRNEIEHRKFILENEKKMCEILFDVIYQLMVFANENLEEDLRLNLSLELKNKLHKTRLELDLELRNTIEKIDEIKKKIKDIQREECPYCLNETVIYYRESRVKCFFCGKELFILRCKKCNKLYLTKDIEEEAIRGKICPDCFYEELGDSEAEYAGVVRAEKELDKGRKEMKEGLPEEKF